MRAGALLAAVALGLAALLWLRAGLDGRAAERSAPPPSVPVEAEPSASRLVRPERAPEPATGAPSAERPPPARTPEPDAPAPRATPADALVGCVLHGRVRSSDGSAFSGWRPFVSMTDAAGLRSQTEVSPEGHYSLAGLAPGAWSLSAGGTGFRNESAELELTRAEPIVRRDLVLVRKPLLAVRVLTPEGETFWEAQRARAAAKVRTPDGPIAVATLAAPGTELEEARDAGQDPVGVGSFWTYGPPLEAFGPGLHGVLELHADPPLFVSVVVGARVVATQRVEPGTREVTFVVDLDALLEQWASVTMRIVAEDTGEPLSGDMRVDSNTMFPVRDGHWSAPLLPGKHTLLFWAPGYARIPLEVTLAPGQELDLGEQRIPRELTIEGRLLDADGQPVLGRLDVGRREPSGKLRFEEDWLFETDASGTFRIHGLVPGRYVVRTVGDDQVVFPHRGEPPTVWVSGNVEVSTLSGSVTGLDLSLVRAGILVLKGAPTLPSESRCKILDERGDLLRHSAFYPGFVPRFALPPGPCTFVLCDGEWRELERHALVIAAGVNELDLTR